MKTPWTLLALAVLVAGCSSNRHCEGEFPYQRATSTGELRPVNGIQPPTSLAALVIPEVNRADAPAYATEEPDPDKPGRTSVRCLDVPPALPEQYLVTPEPDEAS